MAIMLADGFDFYTSSIDAGYVGSPWANTAGIIGLYSGAGQTPYGVGQSIVLNNLTGITSYNISNEPTIYASFNFNSSIAFTGSASNGMFVTLMDGATPQVTLQWAADGNFYVRSGGTAGTILNVGGWPHGMAANSWCHWQAKVVINNTTGSVELRKNNNPADDLNLTGLNTRGGTANNYANTIAFISNLGTTFVDDIFVNSASGAAPNTWPTQLRAIQLMANGDTAQADFTPLSGTTHYTQVSELHMDSDTSYNYASVAGNTDIYNITDLAVTPLAIPLVTVKQALRKSDTGARTGTTHMVSGANVSDGPTVNLATTYQWQNIYLALDPNTSAAWTLAGVNAFQAGPKVVA